MLFGLKCSAAHASSRCPANIKLTFQDAWMPMDIAVSFDMLSRSILKSGRLEIHPEPHGPSEPSWALGAFMGPRPPLAGAPPIVACTTGMCCESCACALCALCALCAPPLRPCTRSRSKHCNRSQSTDRVGARMQLIQNFTSSG